MRREDNTHLIGSQIIEFYKQIKVANGTNIYMTTYQDCTHTHRCIRVQERTYSEFQLNILATQFPFISIPKMPTAIPQPYRVRRNVIERKSEWNEFII